MEIKVSSLDELKKLSQNAKCHSFWGHLNTLKIANEILGFDVSPIEERIAVKLNEDSLPVLAGKAFTECWVLSPDYVKGFRPKIGEEVEPEKIVGWQVLKIKW